MASRKTPALAILEIGWQKFVLPMPSALKISELLQGAVKAELRLFGRHDAIEYVVKGEVEVEMRTVKAERLFSVAPYPALGIVKNLDELEAENEGD